MIKEAKNSFIIYVMSLSVLCASCSGGLSPKDYVHYIENPGNGLLVKEEVNGVNYELQYQPTDYCVMQEKRSFSVPGDEFAQLRKRFSGLEHYVLRIKSKDMDSLVNKMDDTAKYKKGITEYFDFGIQKDIKLIEGKDTVPCSICQADANTGISEYYTFSMGFPANHFEGDRYFVFMNKILKTGNVKLAITDKSMKSLPALKMM